MGSENSTDSVSFASSMAYRLKAGLRKVGRAIVLMTERLTGRPISRETKKRLAMSATRRDTFVWEVVRCGDTVAEKELPKCFVHVDEDIQTAPAVEETVADEFPEEPIREKVYNTPSSVMVSATSSGAMMYEFSSSHFNMDMFSDEGSEEIQAYEPDVVEAPVFRGHIETEEEKQFFEDLYEDLEVEAVLNYMDTIELFAHIETEEEKQFFEDLYEDLEVEAVLDYMDTIELYAAPEEEAAEETIQEQTVALPASQPVAAIAAPVSEVSGYLSAPAVREETEEERMFYESVYEDLTVFAVLDYMDTIELYAKPAPEYVISEIGTPEECITTIDIEPKFVPDYVISEISSPEECETSITIEEEEPVKQSILAQFVFGFDAPVSAKTGPTKVRFVMGTEEESDEEVDSVHVMTYSGDAAVSAQSMSNGPLAL